MITTVTTNKIRSFSIFFVFEFWYGLNNVQLNRSENSMCLNRKFYSSLFIIIILRKYKIRCKCVSILNLLVHISKFNSWINKAECSNLFLSTFVAQSKLLSKFYTSAVFDLKLMYTAAISIDRIDSVLIYIPFVVQVEHRTINIPQEIFACEGFICSSNSFSKSRSSYEHESNTSILSKWEDKNNLDSISMGNLSLHPSMTKCDGNINKCINRTWNTVL